MTKLFALALAAVANTAAAQTPATNPMPDGSRDMYVGLGVVSAPRYEGARTSERHALPVLQVQWSNGVFVSGMGAGMHLSRAPQVEYGPLIEVQPRRDESGRSGEIGSATDTRISIIKLPPTTPENRLEGMAPVHARACRPAAS
ncbi:MipA/OmpV family protein [Massilia sp. Dwa41.01b]|uniref:MipA/OmpV family protein n=1 Tax=Massilia sp. Dwa41.01b TaxID=2709302 RepID=UPI001602B1A1|nr:MipA/OmpV family protein [Massilia sp. Dwa41.01b]QNA88401.1 MipA/OmpV family protein [Massilia sp. Dwa41.01b]